MSGKPNIWLENMTRLQNNLENEMQSTNEFESKKISRRSFAPWLFAIGVMPIGSASATAAPTICRIAPLNLHTPINASFSRCVPHQTSKVKPMTASSPEMNASPYGLIAMNAQESQYMRRTLNTLIQYISGAVTLGQAEEAWGEVGEDHVPKDPKMPVVSRGYFGLGHGFIIHLRRNSEHSLWTSGELSFRPGEPRSYYEINMPKDYFKNLELEKVETQISPVYYEKGHKVHIFTFKFKVAQSLMRIAFYADSMYANPEDGYPKNFDNVAVIRLE